MNIKLQGFTIFIRERNILNEVNFYERTEVVFDVFIFWILESLAGFIEIYIQYKTYLFKYNRIHIRFMLSMVISLFILRIKISIEDCLYLLVYIIILKIIYKLILYVINYLGKYLTDSLKRIKREVSIY